jgi:hypothetical protein
MGPYETWLQAKLPRWLRGTIADSMTTVIGGMIDTDIEGAKDAVKAGLLADCPDDAVGYHARARLLDPLVGETIAALRARALDAWTFWSELGPTVNLRAYLRTVSGAATLELYDQANDDWQAGASTTDDDANADNASRHVIVIPETHPWARDTVGPGLVVGPELIVGIDMTSTELSAIRHAYRKHRPANMVGIDIWVIFSADTAAQVLADHGHGGGTIDAIRLPLHRAMVGYSHHGMIIGESAVVGEVFA